MTVLSMSRTEIDRVHVIRDVLAERIGISEAARLMRVTPRQIFRLLRSIIQTAPYRPSADLENALALPAEAAAVPAMKVRHAFAFADEGDIPFLD
jgi:hypothetical protein